MHRLTLVVTHQCNFDCDYCQQKHEDVHMSFETAKKAIDDLVARMKSETADPDRKAQISFYGGEPLLQKDLIEKTVRYAVSQLQEQVQVKPVFEITTNGLLLDEAFIEFAKKNRVILALSHDGAAQDPVRHDRGGNLTKERVDPILDLLLKNDPETIIMMTVHPEYAGTVSESLKFFRSKGVRAVNITLANGFRVNWTPESFRRLREEMEKAEVLFEQWNQGRDCFKIIPFENKIRNYIRSKDADSAICHFSTKKLMVDVSGRYYPCNHFIGKDDFCIGGQDSGIDEEKIVSLESERVEPETCLECALRSRCRHTCACANHGHTGCMAEVSALQCEYEKLTIELADKAARSLIMEENTAFVARMYKE